MINLGELSSRCFRETSEIQKQDNTRLWEEIKTSGEGKEDRGSICQAELSLLLSVTDNSLALNH